VLAYAIDQAYASPRRALLAEFRTSEEVRLLIARGVLELDARQAATSSLADGTFLLPEPRSP
jgi:hypothetical protein